MGAPKQKWTSEEEAALKAGILKHGPGKWRTILKDPEFSGVLCLRSNVDLKDKWRNMTVMANGWSSREQARLAVKRTKQAPRQDGSPVADTTTAESDEEAADAQAATTSSGSPQIHGSRKSMIRLDNLIMEAISSLKEPGGSNKTTIAAYIEDQYWAPPNFIRLLSGKLKYLTATGKLIKIKRKYRVAPTSTPSDRRRNLSSPFFDSRQRIFSKVDRDYMDMLSTSQIDLEIANKMRNMTPQEAAAAAAQAVAEAEAAIAEAEEAARDAEAHEADAEAAKAFSDATKTLHGRSAPRMVMVEAYQLTSWNDKSPAHQCFTGVQ